MLDLNDFLQTSDFVLDHIGIAVESLEKGKVFYEALGFTAMSTEVVESESTKVGFFTLGNGARIELLEPLDGKGPIAKFLSKRGEGIHHVCLRVKDIEKTMEDLKTKGFQLINNEPKEGAHNCRVAFIHPKAANGVLIELSEKSEDT